jgi:hypothetical protein
MMFRSSRPAISSSVQPQALNLVLAQAPTLLAQGRGQRLLGWLLALPEGGVFWTCAAQAQAAGQRWQRDSMGAMRTGGPEGFAELLSNSEVDGQGGGIKAKAVMSKDGKTFAFHKLNPDGTTAPFTKAYPNDDNGKLQAVIDFDKNLTPQQKLAHAQGLARVEEDQRRWDLDFGLKQDANKRLEQHQRGMLSAAQRTAQAA